MAKKQKARVYQVVRPMWSRVHDRELAAGDVVSFPENPVPDPETGLLPDGAIIVNFDLLEREGALIPYEPQEAEPTNTEVTNG